jgi:hypothetical protein
MPKKRVKLWQMGTLFHNASRYPRKPDVKRIDRLAGILKHGLVAPGACEDGSVTSDLSIVMKGCSVPYDRVVFLHRYIEISYLYTISEPGRFTFFVDPAFPIKTPDDMGKYWVELSQDEVYVLDRVPPEHLRYLAIHPADAEPILKEFEPEFDRLALTVCEYDGTVLWAPKPKPKEKAKPAKKQVSKR